MSRGTSLLAAAWLAAAPAAAGTPGKEAAGFLALAGDARGVALGSPAAALVEGAAALFGNPAAAPLEPGLALGVTHLAWTDGFFGESLVAAIPAGHGAALGVAVFALLHDAVPLTSELLPDGTGEDAALLHGAASVTAGQLLTEAFSIGATLRATHVQLGELLTEGLALDLGAAWLVTPEFRAGAAVRNLGRLVDTRRVRDPMPLALDVSARYELAELAVPLRAYAGGRLPAFGPPGGGLALEGGEFYGASLRIMLEALEFHGLNWAFGLGWHRDLLAIDYCLTPAGDLGWAHRFGLTVRFAPRGEGP